MIDVELRVPQAFVVEVLSGPEVLRDAQRVGAMEALLTRIFVSPGKAMRDELERCDRVFWVKQGDDLVAFLLASSAPLRVDGREVAAYYLGLGATAPRWQGEGLMMRFAYPAAFSEIAAQAARTSPVVWVTTSTPLGLMLGGKLGLVQQDPQDDGTFSRAGERLAQAVRDRLGVPAAPGEHPFVLRGLDQELVFNEEALARQEEAREALGPTLLDRLGVDPRQGDALLVLFRPAEARATTARG